MTTLASEEMAGSLEELSCTDPLRRRTILWLWLGALIVMLLEAPGLIVRDSELGVDIAPLRWIASSLHLFDPSAYSGSVQIEKFGYLFPMAPFFALGELLHIPVWITERLWLATLLTIGIWGIVRVAEALGPSKKWARLLGGVVYCSAPIVIDWSSLSIYLLSVVFLPWALLPLIKGSRGGSPRKMAARSGVAVALMGGVNATVILAALPVPALWLLTRAPGKRRRSLIGWWIVALGLACFWWFGGAVLQGKYGYNYLPYTETAVNTTGPASLFEALRGTSDWLNYYHLGIGLDMTGGYTLISSGVAILGTALLVALGLTGLSLKRIPERMFLVASLVLGVLIIASGYPGPGGGAFSPTVISLLTSPLGVLRNISKFSPDVTFPLVLGLIWVVSRAQGAIRSARPSAVPARRFLARAVVWMALLGTVAAGLPVLLGQFFPAGDFSSIPSYWQTAASWLDRHQGHQTALLVPGSTFATYQWGNAQDEPLSILASSSVTVRSIVPFGSNGNTQMLNVVEDAIVTGTPQPGLAGYLSRSGIDYLVERNNLNIRETAAPRAAQVHEFLSSTPGLVRVASFGPFVAPATTENGSVPVFAGGKPPRLRAVEIYEVRPKASEVRTSPVASPVVVSGGQSSLVPLVAQGIVEGRAAIFARDIPAGRMIPHGATWAVTDGNQRRFLKFGLLHDNASYLLGASQTLALGNSDGVPEIGYGGAGSLAAQTTSAPRGVSEVAYSANVRHFDVGTYVPSPYGPSSAFDGNPATAWVPNLGPYEVGQSVGIRFDHPVFVDKVAISPLDDSPRRSRITVVTVHTQRGKLSSTLPRGRGPFWVRTVPGVTSKVWVTITATTVGTGRGKYLLGPGITDIKIPSVSYRPAMALPTDELRAFSTPGRPAPVLSFADPVENLNFDFFAPQTTPAAWDRRVDVSRAATVDLAGAAVANPGPALDALAARVLTPPAATVRVTASSTLRDLPRFSATNLIVSSPRPWISGLGDEHPTIRLAWNSPRTVNALFVRPSSSASRPTSLLVTDGVTRAAVAVPTKGGVVHFPAMTTAALRVTVLRSVPRTSLLPAGASYAGSVAQPPAVLPPGLAALRVTAVDPQPLQPVAASAAVGGTCGSGPAVEVNGTLVATTLDATAGDLRNLTPVSYRGCSEASLATGSNVLAFPAGGAFRMMTMAAQPVSTSSTSPVVAAPRHARIVTWGSEHRTVAVSAGAATYLEVAQNVNAGWVATYRGVTLTPATLDGWQQAWIVPAGTAGTVTMTFVPDHTFRLVLLVGLLLLLVLVAAARWGRGGDEAPGVGSRRPAPTWLLVALAGVVIIAVSADGFVFFIPLLVLAWWQRRSNVMAILAGGAFLLAGLYVAWSPEPAFQRPHGAFSVVAQLLAALALSALLCASIAAERVRASHATRDRR